MTPVVGIPKAIAQKYAPLIMLIEGMDEQARQRYLSDLRDTVFEIPADERSIQDRRVLGKIIAEFRNCSMY